MNNYEIRFNNEEGRYHIVTARGSYTGKSYVRRHDAQRGLQRMLNA